MAREPDNSYQDGGTHPAALLAVVVAAALFVAGFGFAMWPTKAPQTGPVVSDGSKAQISPAPTAKAGETPASDNAPAPEKSSQQ